MAVLPQKPIKKVDNDAICLINVLKHRNTRKPEDCLKIIFLRQSFGPTFLDLIFYAPQNGKSRILEDSTDNFIIILTIALYYRENVDPPLKISLN